MRDIKFRVWEKKEERFAESGKYVIGLDGGLIYEEMMWLMDKSYFSINQFIGLHDKNGKEIYEGDILEIGRNKIRGTVIYDEDFYCLKHGDGEEDYTYILPKTMTVIGNIHENPELLKEDNQ